MLVDLPTSIKITEKVYTGSFGIHPPVNKLTRSAAHKVIRGQEPWQAGGSIFVHLWNHLTVDRATRWSPAIQVVSTIYPAARLLLASKVSLDRLKPFANPSKWSAVRSLPTLIYTTIVFWRFGHAFIPFGRGDHPFFFYSCSTAVNTDGLKTITIPV